MKTKVLIIGPIEDFGGRELETGFVASVLKKDFEVSVLSTGNISPKSQFYEICEGIRMTSLKQSLFKKYKLLRPATILSYLRNGRKEPIYFYVNNKFNSRLIKSREKSILKETIEKYDLIFVIAHLQTLRTKEIIELSEELEKPLIFRTTGKILKQKFPPYLQKVNHFIHHSDLNARSLHEEINGPKYHIIDQTSFLESELLKIPLANKRVTNFGVIGRLSPEKNLENLILYFKESSDLSHTLYLVGEGELRLKLEKICAGIPNIRIIGSIASTDTPGFFEEIDCLILASYTEAGPLVGVEAMASGRLLLSTKVGAMEERLRGTGNDFWFEADDQGSFEIQFKRIKELDSGEISKIAMNNRNAYLKKYSQKEIAESYINAVNFVNNDNNSRNRTGA